MRDYYSKIVFLTIFCALQLFPQERERAELSVIDFHSQFSSRSRPDPVPNDEYYEKEKVAGLISPSTVIFEEDFEGTTGFPPSGWKIVNADGGGLSGPWFQGNVDIFTAFSNSGYAAANYQGANDFYIDEWLISPKIVSIGESDTLTFRQRSPDYSAWSDSVEVLISTTDTALASFTTHVEYFKTSTSGWSQKRYPLADYVSPGSSIYIAFRYLLYEGGISGLSSDYAGIDLVQIVRPQVEKDINVASVDFPFLRSKIPLGQSADPAVTFRNAGTLSQTDIPVLLRIVPPSGSVYESAKSVSALAPGETRQVTFGSYTPFVPGEYTVRAYSLLTGDQNSVNDSLISSFRGSVYLSGQFSVGAGGDISSLKEAADTLNNNIISGDVSFSLVDPSYSEPALTIGPLDYTYGAMSVSIKPAAGISPVIDISAASSDPYGIAVIGTSKFKIDGSNSAWNQRNMTINIAGGGGKIGILIRGDEGAGSDSNTVENLNIRLNADPALSSEGGFGILAYGYSSFYKDIFNRISNCDITDHGAVGIAAQWQDGIVIEKNYIHDWNQTGGENDIRGIWLADGSVNAIVRNNIIGDLETDVNYFWAYGIENSSGAGSNARVYNNMIYRVLSSGSGINANYTRGVYGSNPSNSGDAYCFNSIYLSGTDYSLSPSSNTAGFELVGGTDISLKNNIVFNETELSGSSSDNKAYCVYLTSVPAVFASDNNDFYAPGIEGATGYNSGNRITLAQWVSSFSPGQDSLSISGDPFFISRIAGNLHIRPDSGSPADGAARPVAGVTQDIDGNYRNPLTPDIGADEFVSGGFFVSLIYNTNWNLVSVPAAVADYTKTSLFPGSVSDAFSYRGSYVADSVLTCGAGYWLKFGEQQYVDIAGSPVLEDTVDVAEGWNLVGSLSYPVHVSSITQIPDGIVSSKYFRYDGGYLESDTLMPGHGYWIKADFNGKLIIRVQ